MIVSLILRGELYALFRSALDYPVRAAAYDWLALWLRLSKLRAGAPVPLFEMITVSRLERKPDPQGLLELLGNTRIFRLIPSADHAPGFIVDLGPGEGLSQYLEDRVGRYQRVLQHCAEISATADPLERDLRLGQLLFNEGLYFDCHEYLESAWNHAQGEEKEMVQGIIQAAAAFHKWELGSPAGCTELLHKSLERLGPMEEVEGREDMFSEFVNSLGTTLDRVSRGNFELSKAPKMAIWK